LRQPLDATLFGFIPVPPIVPGPDRALHGIFESSHKILAWSLAALILVHIGGAIYHAVVKRDDVLQRMLPAKRRQA
jgi:cytochrome b561